MSIANNIKQLRKQKHLTQKQLAEKSGLAVITIQQYEAGKFNPKPDTVMKLCVGLDCKITDIIDDETQKYYRMFDNIKETNDTTKYTNSDSNNNIHKYDATIRIKPTPEQMKDYLENAEAEELLKKQASGEKLTDEECKKVSNYIERTKEIYAKLSEEIEQHIKIISKYLNASVQISTENFQLLKEKFQELTDMITPKPDNYETLNDIGQQKAKDYISDLSNIPEYRKETDQNPNKPPQE